MFVLLLVLIERQCMYDGSSTYWSPDSSYIKEQCPNGTQRVSERIGVIANQVIIKCIL